MPKTQVITLLLPYLVIYSFKLKVKITGWSSNESMVLAMVEELLKSSCSRSRLYFLQSPLSKLSLLTWRLTQVISNLVLRQV